MKVTWLVLLVASIPLGALALAGTGTVAPKHKSYKFMRTDPSPTEVVGHGDFREGDEQEGEDPEGEYLDVNPVSGNPSTWKQHNEGHYRPEPDTGDRRLCFYDDDVPQGADYRYQQKFNGDVISSGTLTD